MIAASQRRPTCAAVVGLLGAVVLAAGCSVFPGSARDSARDGAAHKTAARPQMYHAVAIPRPPAIRPKESQSGAFRDEAEESEKPTSVPEWMAKTKPITP
jgi:hypothetical protein